MKENFENLMMASMALTIWGAIALNWYVTAMLFAEGNVLWGLAEGAMAAGFTMAWVAQLWQWRKAE